MARAWVRAKMIAPVDTRYRLADAQDPRTTVGSSGRSSGGTYALTNSAETLCTVPTKTIGSPSMTAGIDARTRSSGRAIGLVALPLHAAALNSSAYVIASGQ